MSNYEKLKAIIEEIDVLISKGVTSSDPEFKAWKTKSERFLRKQYGDESYECSKFINTCFSPMIIVHGSTHSDFVEACKKGLETTKMIFETYISEMEEDIVAQQDQIVSNINPTYSKIFIVHGHDGELKQSVARIVEKQGIEAIILSEQANRGRTIIEKFESYSDVSGAICLFTADDFGRAKNDTADKSRARQNVVLETGYFMGKLNRDHVVLLADKDIEIPSDLSGVVYTDTGKWEVDLLKELKAIGYTVDFNKLF